MSAANLASLVRYWGAWRPDHAAIIFGDEVESWSYLDDVSDTLARGLARRGVGKGDRVGILMTNRPELAHLSVACLKLGAICVPLNFRLTATEMTPLLEDATPKVVITEGSLAHLLEPGHRSLGFELFATEGTDLPPYSTLLADPGTAPIVDIDPSDGAFICYTSGTTGVQKGALLTHGSVEWPGRSKGLADGITWRDRALIAVPLVYTGAMVSMFMQVGVAVGASIVLEADFDPDRYLANIERHRVTVLSTVPVVWERMASSPEFATADISSLWAAGAGGAPVRLDLLETYIAKGIPLIQSYGLTEASGHVAMLRPEDAASRIGFAGSAIYGTEVRIIDDEMRTKSPHEIGEIAVRGPHVMREYWNKPDATAATIVDGWLRTGDLGLMDEQGFLKLVDRTKDMLISGGLNVYPAEIEKALAGIDGIVDLAVIGVPDEAWGEVPMLVLHATRDLDAVLGDIAARAARDLAGYKRPKIAVVCDEPLARTFSGKIAKPVLRKQYPAVPPEARRLFTSR